MRESRPMHENIEQVVITGSTAQFGHYTTPLYRHPPVSAAPVVPDHDEAITLLSAVFDAWENGDDCHEDGDPSSTYMGKCFQLDDDVFDRCCFLLNRLNPPRNVAPVVLVDRNEVLDAPKLSVWYGSMPETNGKSNFTAILNRADAEGMDEFDGFTIARSEYPDRVRYEPDCVRHLIGELAELPFILDYDADKRSDYVAPTSVPQLAVPQSWRKTLQGISDWLGSSAQIVQNGPDDYGPATEFDYQLGQAADEIQALLNAAPIAPDAQDAPSDEQNFAAWIEREMPAGTMIGDPKWWAPRILRAVCHSAVGAEPAGAMALLRNMLSAKPLDPEFEKVLHENRWELYATDEQTAVVAAPVSGEVVASRKQLDLRAMFECEVADRHLPEVARGLSLKNPDGSFQVSSIEMEYRAWVNGFRKAERLLAPTGEKK